MNPSLLSHFENFSRLFSRSWFYTFQIWLSPSHSMSQRRRDMHSGSPVNNWDHFLLLLNTYFLKLDYTIQGSKPCLHSLATAELIICKSKNLWFNFWVTYYHLLSSTFVPSVWFASLSFSLNMAITQTIETLLYLFNNKLYKTILSSLTLFLTPLCYSDSIFVKIPKLLAF